jgi:uncharacterized membrane protein
MSLAMHSTQQRAAARTNTGMLAVRATEFVAIFLQVLVAGAFWGSWIGLSRSIDALTPGTFVEVGHVMMADYGPIMSVLMPAAAAATLVAGVLVYRRQASAGYLLLAGCACVVGATVITLLVNVPIDEMMAGWTAATLPADWTQVRDRWEAYHTVRTFLSLGALAITLAGSLLRVRVFLPMHDEVEPFDRRAAVHEGLGAAV